MAELVAKSVSLLLEVLELAPGFGVGVGWLAVFQTRTNRGLP